METILLILAFLFLLVGLLGSIFPALPGPPLSFAGLVLLQWSGHEGFNLPFLLMWAVITIAVTIIDNFLPAWMTKRFGGSHMAMAGSVLGLAVGVLFFAPVGLLIGPFLGALAGELINNRIQAKRNEINTTDGPADCSRSDKVKPLKVALGAFLAFIVGTGAKLIIGSLMLYYAVKMVFR